MLLNNKTLTNLTMFSLMQGAWRQYNDRLDRTGRLKEEKYKYPEKIEEKTEEKKDKKN